MNPFRKKIFLDPLHKKEKEGDRRSFIRKSLTAIFGATILSNAEDLFSMESKTGYVYVKQNGEVINNYSPSVASPFLGQITIYGCSFAPTGWAKCDGQIIAVSSNPALFSLLSNRYGGNGTSTFGLPDFRGRVPVHQGQGQGLSLYELGQTGGFETVTLLQSQIPAHIHTVNTSSQAGTTSKPINDYLAQNIEGIGAFAGSANVNLNSGSIGASGSGLPHNNMQPSLVLNFCIATQGVFPSR